MRVNALLSFVCILVLSGCVSTQYAAVPPGTLEAGGLTFVSSDARWNRAPGTLTADLREGSQLWTRDGVLLDQLLLLGPVAHEQTLFVSNSETLVYPTFRKQMLPGEVEQLVQASLSKRLGSDAIVRTMGLRPTTVSGNRAVRFDYLIEHNEQPTKQGEAIAVLKDDALHLMMYHAPKLYYFDKHQPIVRALLETARWGAG